MNKGPWELVLGIVSTGWYLLMWTGFTCFRLSWWSLITLIFLGISISAKLDKEGSSVDGLPSLFVPKAWLIAGIIVVVLWGVSKLLNLEIQPIVNFCRTVFPQ